jgi:hypothetical protein
VDESAEYIAQYTMATPDVTKEKEPVEDDLSYLSVKKESKIERCTKKRVTSHGPSKIIVILKWLTTLIFAAVLLSSLVTSKLTVIGVSHYLNKDTDIKYQAFIMCLVILLVPNVISIFRSVWNIIGRSDIPWPNKKSIALVSLETVIQYIVLDFYILFQQEYRHQDIDIPRHYHSQ